MLSNKGEVKMSDCVFCKIINKDLPAKVIYEDFDLIAFHDISPLAPVHVLIVPKKHVASIADVEDGAVVAKAVMLAGKIAKELGVAESGFRLVSNVGADGGQTVHHLHFHLLAGKALGSMC